jgi:glycosyltransferase involved in cell wall biosynthesis
VRVSVITPSYNGWPLTRLCVASVADQGVDLEHIIQDAGSTDETASALQPDQRVRFFQEKDRGMYDALNRGFDRATGEILGWLNCDERSCQARCPLS